jgi:hypothetical protein
LPESVHNALGAVRGEIDAPVQVSALAGCARTAGAEASRATAIRIPRREVVESDHMAMPLPMMIRASAAV